MQFNGNNLLNQSQFNKNDYACSKELLFDNINHPILEYIEESKITLKYLKPHSVPIATKKCVILPKGLGSVKSMTSQDIDKFQNMAQIRGFDVDINGNIEGAGWVIGVENAKFYEAAINGVKVSLFPTGIGTKFFQRVFPNGEILS